MSSDGQTDMGEQMIVIRFIAAATVLLLTGASLLAVERRLGSIPTLPMQWDLRGRVNWKAYRRMALSLTPVLAAVLLGWTVWCGQVLELWENAAVLLALAIVFIAVHALHLWLVLRWVGRR